MPTPGKHIEAQHRTLDNGLRVIVAPRREAPIGTFWIWYRVGARNEVPGVTGVSHWLEHMLFKGTEKLAKGDIFRRVTANGGSLNGFTWLDYTAYFETLPIDRIDLAFDIESDRMANARVAPDEVASERTVIISEKQGSDNQPTTLLREEVAAAAFKAHPYGQGVIGYLSDLERLTREDLYRHYQTYYQPNNAVAVFAGDLDAEDAFARIEAAFGSIARGVEPPAVRTIEPPQFGERRVTVNRPAPNAVVQFAQHAVNAAHPDVPALAVLDAVLSGGSGLGMGGGGGMGRSSRLYRALVATGLAAAASSSFSMTIDPYLFGISASLRPETEPARIEEAINGELTRLMTEPVGEPELARAKKQLRAQDAYGLESVGGLASMLGALAMVAPERDPDSLMDEIEAVTAEDVQRVADVYLSEHRRTVGWLVPTVESGGGVAAPADGFAAPAYYTPDAADRGLDESLPVVRETRLGNGLRVATLEPNASATAGSVAIRLRLPGGSALDDGRPGVARFTAEMLTRGSAGRALDDLAEELDGLGASLGASAGRETTDVVAKALLEDADRVVALLADATLRPDFPAQQAEIVRGQLLSGLRHARSDTRAEAEHMLRGMLYPPGHPYRERVSGTDESVIAMTRDDLTAFHSRAYAPRHAFVAVAGGLSHEAAVALIERHLGGWSGAAPPLTMPDEPPATVAAREDHALPGKTQADVAIGTLALERHNPDFYALSMGNLILGRLGLMGRLGESVRERQGMAYYAFSTLEAGLGTGFWSARAGVNPENVERTIDSVLEELRAYLADGPTEQEFSDAVGNLTGSLPLGLETGGSIAAVVADILFFDLGADYLRRYRGVIRNLTREGVTDVMRRYVDPDRLAVAVARPA